jgi:5,10-methenyltetrahydrofolate synthetase
VTATLPQPARDVAGWRRAERARLLEERAALSNAARREAAERIAGHLDRLLAERFDSLAGLTISGWWPIKAELDLRFWLAGLAGRGARAALPVVAVKGRPLVFREWTPATKMERGFWNIPVPAEGPDLEPDVILAPVVGFDGAGYRLGYGGGYFDRTLGALDPRPLAIGVGLDAARLATVHPQPHDVPMQAVVTETGIVTPGHAAAPVR